MLLLCLKWWHFVRLLKCIKMNKDILHVAKHNLLSFNVITIIIIIIKCYRIVIIPLFKMLQFLR